MENQFTVNKRGRYYNVEYIGYKSHSVKFDVWHWNNTYLSSKDEVIKFINAVAEFETLLAKRLKAMNLNYNPKKIIRMSMKNLDNILIGIDIRAKLSLEEKVDMYINGHHKRHQEADEFCKTIFETVKEYHPAKNDNWRTYEDYDTKRDIYELDYPDLEPYFGVDAFDELLGTITNMNIKLELYKKKMESYNL